MRISNTLLALISLVLISTSSFSFAGENEAQGKLPLDKKFLDSITSITLHSMKNTVVIKDAKIIKEFTAAIGELKPKDASLCDHVDSVDLASAEGTVQLSICPSCFVVISKDAQGKIIFKKDYEMPKAFYDLFIKQMGDKHYLKAEKEIKN